MVGIEIGSLPGTGIWLQLLDRVHQVGPILYRYTMSLCNGVVMLFLPGTPSRIRPSSR